VHDCRDAGGRAIREKIAEDAQVPRRARRLESGLEQQLNG